MQQQPASSKSLVGAEPATWAATVEHRLKFLRARLAAEPPDVRNARLEEALRKELRAVPAADRKRFLAVLVERFPSWDLATVATYAAQPPGPEEIVKSFLELAPTLPAGEADRVREQLTKAGFIEPPKPATPLEGEALADVQNKLKLALEDEIDEQRLGKLFAALAEMAVALDQLAWNLWRSAAPQSPVRRDPNRGDLRQLLRRSLTGDAETSATQVQQQLEATRQLIAGLFASLGSAGRSFSQRYHQRYSPEAISAALEAEGGGGLFANAEAKCWRKYTELATELADEAIANLVRDEVIKDTEELIRGRNR